MTIRGKKLKWIIASVVIVAFVGVWLFVHFYVSTVTDYVLVQYTPPQREASMFGGYSYSKPEVKIEHLPEYSSIEVAIEAQTKAARNMQQSLMEMIEDTNSKMGEYPDHTRQAMVNAFQSLAAREWYVVSISHTRRFDAEEAINHLSENWGRSIQDYANDKKLEVTIHRVY